MVQDPNVGWQAWVVNPLESYHGHGKSFDRLQLEAGLMSTVPLCAATPGVCDD